MKSRKWRGVYSIWPKIGDGFFRLSVAFAVPKGVKNDSSLKELVTEADPDFLRIMKLAAQEWGDCGGTIYEGDPEDDLEEALDRLGRRKGSEAFRGFLIFNNLNAQPFEEMDLSAIPAQEREMLRAMKEQTPKPRMRIASDWSNVPNLKSFLDYVQAHYRSASAGDDS